MQKEEKIKLISRHLKNALMQVKLSMDDILFISRGDSTLRGHGFLEPKIINQEFTYTE